MTKNHHFRTLAFALAGLLAMGVLARNLLHEDGSTQAADKNDGEEAVTVEMTAVTRFAFADEVTAVGTLKSNESVIIRPEISGRIDAVYFKDGEKAQAGRLLLSLDAGIQEAEWQQARAQLALAEANQRRNEELFQKKFISPQALDNTRSALRVQEANLALAAARLAKTKIRAPFDGILGIRDISPGDYVKEGDALFNLEDINTLKLDFRLPEIHLNRLAPGLSLEATTDALPDERFFATLTAINPLVDEGGRSIACRALLDNREGKLRPGMFARVRLTFDEGANKNGMALAVPEEAVITGKTPQVLRVENGIARNTPVRLGRRREGRVEVLEGLREGDLIVTSGHLKARDGDPVRANPNA
ncbi:MAG: efflux RND transporter periplasmic adaptor subunit [Zoogloeaceae bacterium]|jgi:membrane fusion protein (multidrug efflux system)|nr:efflux RND transporter periplasmic adaptor subunit [Zoogloeaceae bacterium]